MFVIPENLPDRMPEDMPDKILENILDKMLENLLITKYIDVMMELIWNKIFFKINYFIMICTLIVKINYFWLYKIFWKSQIWPKYIIKWCDFR